MNSKRHVHVDIRAQGSQGSQGHLRFLGVHNAHEPAVRRVTLTKSVFGWQVICAVVPVSRTIDFLILMTIDCHWWLIIYYLIQQKVKKWRAPDGLSHSHGLRFNGWIGVDPATAEGKESWRTSAQSCRIFEVETSWGSGAGSDRPSPSLYIFVAFMIHDYIMYIKK